MGQKELFLKIWGERPHYCVVCNNFLGHEPLAHYFAHLLPKGTYPKFKLNPENIELFCLNCHQDFDHYHPKHEKFESVNNKKDRLKEEYFAQF